MLRVLAALLFAFALGSNGFAAEPIRIDLAPNRQLPNQVVQLKDIAMLTGGNLIARRKIAALDIVTLENDKSESVTRRQIEVRVLLAGFDRDQFRVIGADFVRIKRTTAEQRVLDFLRPEIAKRLSVPEKELQVRLTRPIPERDAVLLTDDTSLQHNLKSQVRVGPFSAILNLSRDGRSIHSLTVNLEAQVYKQVFVANHVIEAGTTLSAKDFTREQRFIDGRTRRNLPELVEGREVRRLVPAGEVITHLHLAKKSTRTARREIAIRSRDIVEVVAEGSAVQVTIKNAVALQSGAVGESIRLRNPRNPNPRAIFTAEVISPGRARIRL